MTELAVEDGATEMATCSLCAHAAPKATTYLVNDQVTCATCVAGVHAELAAQAPRLVGVLVATVGGIAGALVGAAVWAAVAIATDFEVGYIAVLVGFLTGLGVKIGAGTQRGLLFQRLAAHLAIVGLLAAKYMLFAYAMVKLGRENGVDVGYFDSRVLPVFPDALREMVSAFDVLFLILAVMAAHRVPKAAAISISKV